MSRVRIHIVDPRPHYQYTDNLLRDLWKRDDAPAVLASMSARKEGNAIWLRNQIERVVADCVLHESAAAHAERLAALLADPLIDCDLLPSPPTRNTTQQSLSYIHIPPGKVGEIAKWSAKSSAVFYSALEVTDDFADAQGSNVEMYLRRKMASALVPSHAFDKGNTQHITSLDDTRHSVYNTVVGHDRRLLLSSARPKNLVEVESASSYYVQAADFAAGMASDLFMSKGLVGVVAMFECVTYNGTRVSLSDAEEEIRKQRR